VKVITRDVIEKDVKKCFKHIIKDNPDIIPTDPTVLKIWGSSNKITREFRNNLQTAFDKLYRKRIESDYKGYVLDNVFEDVLLNGPDNVDIPEHLKQKFRGIEAMTAEEVVAAISNNIYRFYILILKKAT